MASLLHGLVQTRHIDKPSINASVFTSSDNQYSQVNLSVSAAQQHALHARLGNNLTQQLATGSKLSLIKQVSLGGRDIYQHIIDSPLDTLDSIINQCADIAPSAVSSTESKQPTIGDNSPLSVNNSENSAEPLMTEKITDKTFPKQPRVASMINHTITPAQLTKFQQKQGLAKKQHLPYLAQP